ncbi:P-loop containing nucleoside triphosphate hydrolase protein [Gymnopilus junonius]|uniref:ATP-dependent DNA helicase n=1 Tax=Gymnopilus junonius TaxID=109634 RepID=A0A9P5NVN5_GYMJU|nr:P-loop containing nucleoside triphosphate hydrolase protein [Gymnopilus junonius]
MHDVTLESAPSTSFLAPTTLATTDCTKNSGKGSLVSSPYYCEIVDKLRNVFRLTEFRPNQLEAITAALGGRDVFVLMPTGGGKSLCFQLPGVCASGKTQGVTVVVSPLLALMKDQVDSLIKKQVNALLSNAETVGEDWQLLVRNERKPKLWYVTPEKLRDSPKVNEILSILYREKKLARFVIDEAHCISTWGQDFRDAYTSLGSLREKYPSVPIMALTATANKRTVKDIVTQLKLKDQASFSQSFNRPNLKYLVQRKKPDSPIIEIVEFIQTKHRGEGGVIYCNTRAKCESVAEVLRSKGLSAAHFHAGMSTQEKDHTVCSWQNGTTLIIVATIAFGMGIDKPDVRFVIHHDMPKSMSGYYQETGRAGRDGKPADCLMFFSGVDLKRLIFQIQNGDDTTPESVQRQINAAREVIQFAENTSECRRVQILRHFDEKFAKAECARGCDTCEDGRETVSKDVTEYAQVALRLVQFLNSRKENITLQQLKGILRGANTVEIRAKQHDKLPQYAYCESLPKELIELMLNRLLSFDMLMNVPVKNRSGFHNDYLEASKLFSIYSIANLT